MNMKMLQAIPELPVKDIKRSIDFYCKKLGFTLSYHEGGFAVLLYNALEGTNKVAQNNPQLGGTWGIIDHRDGKDYRAIGSTLKLTLQKN
jgi:catechol 2,3-dioxygenase-like lactoylglutathione lyase family enzyme